MKERICSLLLAIVEFAALVLCIGIFALIISTILKETAATSVILCVFCCMLLVVGIVFFAIDTFKNFLRTFDDKVKTF